MRTKDLRLLSQNTSEKGVVKKRHRLPRGSSRCIFAGKWTSGDWWDLMLWLTWSNNQRDVKLTERFEPVETEGDWVARRPFAIADSLRMSCWLFNLLKGDRFLSRHSWLLLSGALRQSAYDLLESYGTTKATFLYTISLLLQTLSKGPRMLLTLWRNAGLSGRVCWTLTRRFVRKEGLRLSVEKERGKTTNVLLICKKSVVNRGRVGWRFIWLPTGFRRRRKFAIFA